MDIKKEFGTDKTLENEGVWQDIGDGARVLVARINNKAYSDELKRLSVPHKIAIRNDRLSDEVWLQILIEVTAKTLLLGWSGIEYDGKPLPYSTDNSMKILTEFKDFRDSISGLATSMELFKQNEKAAAIKN